MYAKLGYGWGNSLLGFLALGIGVPFPILIYRVIFLFVYLVLHDQYGARIREHGYGGAKSA